MFVDITIVIVANKNLMVLAPKIDEQGFRTMFGALHKQNLKICGSEVSCRGASKIEREAR